MAESDFKNGVYSIGGVTKVLADQWGSSDGWGVFDPSHVVADVGLQAFANTGENIDGDRQPTSTDELFAAINTSGGILAVMDYSLTATGDGAPQTGFVALELPNYSSGWEFTDNDQSPGFRTVVDYTDETRLAASEPHVDGTHRVAVLLSDSGLSFCVDGGTTRTLANPMNNDARNSFVIYPTAVGNSGTATATVMKMTFYDPATITSLQELSA